MILENMRTIASLGAKAAVQAGKERRMRCEHQRGKRIPKCATHENFGEVKER